MKRFITLVLCAAAALAAHTSALAQASSPNGQAQFGNTTNMLTVDLWSARYVDLTPGAQKVIDRSGATITGAFVNDTAFTFSEAGKRYAKVGTYLYQNTSQSSKVECSAGSTVISWNAGSPETLVDSCARASTIWGISRR